MSMARNRLIMGIEYALSLSVNIRESDELHSSLLAESVFTNRLFLVHILSPVKQNEDIDLLFLIERYGEKLRRAIRKEATNLSESIARIMIKRPPVRDNRQMTGKALEQHIEALFGQSIVTDALLQYAAAIIWSACKRNAGDIIPNIEEFHLDRGGKVEFWSLFEFEKSQITHPITMIYSKAKRETPSVLLDLMDILMPYIGTDVRQNYSKNKTFSSTVKRVLNKPPKTRTISGTFKRNQTQDD